MRTTLRWLVTLAFLLFATGAMAGSPPADTAAGGVLRVGTSGDYPPFSENVGEERAPLFAGFDIRLAKAYAEDRGLQIEWVAFSWPRLLSDLAAGRFDVAMSGITVRPERSAVGRFSVPVVETGAVVLVREIERWRNAEGLDHPVARIGVNAGGHLEQVARRHFSRATLISIPSNAAVVQALSEGALDAAVSDTLEAPLWLSRGGEGTQVLGPFTRDRKAYLVRADRGDLAADLDAWLMAGEADGTLAALRLEMLGSPMEPVATPLGALLAAIDERLTLMPTVGAAKREQGFPLEVPEREALVLDAAVAGVHRSAESANVESPPDELVRSLFRAQMTAAKRVQWEAVQDEEVSGPLPGVEDVLRPALLRIGERIATLLVALPPGLDQESVRAAARSELRAPHLDGASIDAIADAISALSQPRVTIRASPPASTGSTRQTE